MIYLIKKDYLLLPYLKTGFKKGRKVLKDLKIYQKT